MTGNPEHPAAVRSARPRRRGWLRRWGVRVLLTAVLAGLALGLVPRLRGFTLGDAENFIGAALPAAARDIHFAARDSFARVVWIRFTLPPQTDPAPFVESLRLGTPLRDSFTPFPAPNYTEADLPWWTPHAAGVGSGLHAIARSRVYDLLLDSASPDGLTVYLRVVAL